MLWRVLNLVLINFACVFNVNVCSNVSQGLGFVGITWLSPLIFVFKFCISGVGIIGPPLLRWFTLHLSLPVTTTIGLICNTKYSLCTIPSFIIGRLLSTSLALTTCTTGRWVLLVCSRQIPVPWSVIYSFEGQSYILMQVSYISGCMSVIYPFAGKSYTRLQVLWCPMLPIEIIEKWCCWISMFTRLVLISFLHDVNIVVSFWTNC